VTVARLTKRAFIAGVAVVLGEQGVRAESTETAVKTCPDGMLLISGDGSVGMRGDPYGVVPTAHLEKVEAPEKDCPQALAKSPGATVCWVQTDLVDPVIPVHSVSVQPFCIDADPIPGKGFEYASDGMSVWDAYKLDELLKTGRFGARRMCTTTEFQAAVADLVQNQRFVFGDRYEPGVCSGERIGERKNCRNRYSGVSEYGAVHSHWTVADEQFVRSACPSPPCKGAGNRALTVGMYVVAGGTDRAQTRQAPMTPHTWHDHGEPTVDACGFHGWDDQPVICSDPISPTAEQASAWSQFVENIRKTKSVRKAISTASGGPICGGD